MSLLLKQAVNSLEANLSSVHDQVNTLVDGAPIALQTLTQLASTLNDDESFASTVANTLASKANTTDVTAALELKAATTDVNNALVLNANTDDVTAALELKAATTDVNTALELKANTLDTQPLLTCDPLSTGVSVLADNAICTIFGVSPLEVDL